MPPCFVMSQAPHFQDSYDAALALDDHVRARSEHVERLRATVWSTSAHRLAAFDLSTTGADGTLTKLRRNAYSTSDPGTVGDQDCLILMACAVSDAASDPPVFSNDTAAAIWALPTIGTSSSLVEYLMPPGTRGRSPDVRRRRTGLAADAVEVGGLRVASYERTIVDHARHARLESGVSVCDSALHTGRTTRELLLAEAGLIPKGARGRSMANLAVHLADERAESPLESLSRVRMFQAGLPMPELQWKFFEWDVFIGRTDFYWRHLGLVGECDGKLKYAVQQGDSERDAVDALLQEKQRELRLRRHADVDDIARWNWAEALAPGRLHGILGAHRLRTVLDGGWPVPDGPLPKRAFAPIDRPR